jgi:nucleoside 2-deoxyribosyltransferase
MKLQHIYLASSMSLEFREHIKKAAEILRKTFNDVYVPMENAITNAWDYPNNEWGLMVFEDDLNAINKSDAVVLLNYGRKNTTAGCAWEAGYAFGKGIKVFVVDIPVDDDKFITSLMIENGRYATITGLKGLEEYDWEGLPQLRSEFEQK